MDIFLDRITQHALNYAIRSGITITAGYALQQTTRLLKNVEALEDRHELKVLQSKLQSKIRIITPAIDMIDLISARGNTTLESAVELTTKLRHDIQSIAQRLEVAAAEETLAKRTSIKRSKADRQLGVRSIITDLKRLLEQIEDAVPFLNLAITTSGAKVSSAMPATISPSRLLQASTFLTASDARYALQPAPTQVGPTFTLSLYMLFAGHVRPQVEEDVRSSTWKEVMHKAKLKLMRVPLVGLGYQDGRPSSTSTVVEMGYAKIREEYAYQLLIIEDLDDDRVHTFEEDEPQPGCFEGVDQAGIREIVPVHELSKIFYADTGKILNIGGDEDKHRPILLLKRDIDSLPPHRFGMAPLPDDVPQIATLSTGEPQRDRVQSALDAQFSLDVAEQSADEVNNDDIHAIEHKPWRIPSDLDPEWLALEVYNEQVDVNEDDGEGPDSGDEDSACTHRSTVDDDLTFQVKSIKLDSPDSRSPTRSEQESQATAKVFPEIRTSLSLLEVLLRLASLQQFQQMSHLSIEDEFLNFFLSEATTTGAATGDEHERRRLREEARRRVGFDPYDESPIKRRGEDYQYRGGTSQAGWDEAHHPGTPMLPSIEDSRYLPRDQRTGVITPRGYRSSSSDFPPLPAQGSPSRMTPERSTPPSSTSSTRYRNLDSPRHSKYLSVRPSNASPLARLSIPGDDQT